MENIDVVVRQKAIKAASFYTRLSLFFYDYYVYKFGSALFFGCPERELVDFYLDRISSNHLEIGVGTGYLLNKCAEQGKLESLSLLDFNRNCLDVTAKVLSDFRPDRYYANILEPLPVQNRKFDSIALNFVLHCVPGSFREKGVAFDHVARCLNMDGRVFGSTLMYYPEQAKLGKLVMDVYNRLGIFNNNNDSRDELVTALSRNYSDININQVGNVLFFDARVRKNQDTYGLYRN